MTMKTRLIALILTLIAIAPFAQGQEYRFEIGPAVGVSGYLGDLNNSNLFKHIGIAGGVLFRYNANSRWAIKANALYVGLKGNSADINTRFPYSQIYEFSSKLVDIGGQVEFNFLNYGIGPKYKKYKRISPYLTLGLGATISHSQGTYMGLSLPMGAGVKFKLKERLNLGFEFTMRKDFGDKIDGLSDLNGVPHSFAKNTDWYSVGIFSITYEFSKRCTKCHYVE